MSRGDARFVYISSYWFGLEFVWQALISIVLPLRVLTLVGPATKGTALAVVLSTAAAVSLVAQPLAGTLSDATVHPLGRRRPWLAGGTVLAVLGLAAVAASPTLPLFALSVILLFVGTHVAQAPSQSLVSDLAPEGELGRASGFLALGTLLGAGLGPLAVGLLIARSGLLPATVAMAGVLIACLAVTFAKVEEARPDVPSDAQASLASQVRNAFRLQARTYSEFYKLQVARFFVLLTLTTVTIYLLYFLEDVLRVSRPTEATGFVLAAAVGGSLLVALPASAVSDRLGRKKVIYLAAVGGLLSVGALTFVQTLGAVVSVALLFGVSLGAFLGTQWAFTFDLIPKESAGRFLGYTQFSTTFAQVLAPILGGPLIDRFAHTAPATGYRWLFAAAFVYLTVGLVVLTTVKEPPRALAARGSLPRR